MNNRDSLLKWAIKDNNVVHIDEVESGLMCGCVCPACGKKLVAKKGNKVTHHFAHYAGHTCEYGYESSLHLAAKEVLSRVKSIEIPAVYVEFPKSPKRKVLLSPSKVIPVDKVELEKRFDDIIPDIIVYSGKKRFIVEIYVTHKIDDNKLAKIKKANISTIEIDLSQTDHSIAKDELETLLLSDCSEKMWKHNALAQRYLRMFYKHANKMDLYYRGFALHVDYCPIHSREWHGKPFANVWDDCFGCAYCVLYADTFILCTGKKRIATIEDFSIDEETRIKQSNLELDRNRSQMVSEGRCPFCGGDLVERNGKHGSFLGCSNYPHCSFTATIDSLTGEIKPRSKMLI